MIKTIRTSKASRVICCYLALMIILEMTAPMAAYALTDGPSQPEFNSFTPIGSSDMVDLSSGDMNYNIPIMDVGGYPINLAYSSGVTMDQEASWVGLGWNLNVGQINRNVRGLPDDFNGDEVRYENNLKKNQTVGASISIHPAFVGADVPIDISFGLGVTYNNYTGFSYKVTKGFSFEMSNGVSVGLDLNSSSSEGVTISPNTKFNSSAIPNANIKVTGDMSLNSREGLTNFGLSSSFSYNKDKISRSAQGGYSRSFLKTDYTPSKRIGYKNQSFAFNQAIGFECFGGEGQGEMYAYASTQEVKDSEKDKLEKAYGYENTDAATKNDVLDFNRQNDREVNRYTASLPVTNYTYDQYSIQGQGISGSFRPHRGQVGYVFDGRTQDESSDAHFGVEVGPGGYVHAGVEFRYSPSTSFTGLWETSNLARANFMTSPTDPNLITDYEKVYFRAEGETDVDSEYALLTTKMGGEDPVRIGLQGAANNKQTIANKYRKGAQEATTYTDNFQKIKRNNRITRNQAIQKITKTDFNKFYEGYSSENKPKINANAKSHHTVGIRVLQPDGTTYIYDQPVYNTTKQEATFNVTGNALHPGELVAYSGTDDTPANSRGSDHFFNRITTPAYAHTYLITEILSPDYEDVDYENVNTRGPSDNDLGSYTKFSYVQKNSNYKWRVPFEQNRATYNPGLYTLDRDATGNYVYGEKELIYLEKIETKTHIAIFTLSPRKDGYGVNGKDGGLSENSKMYKVDKISLYSKPEYQQLQEYLADNNPANDNLITPIKEAHFVYDYSLLGAVSSNPGYTGVPNNNKSQQLGYNELTNGGGKLTLLKVYFTYRGSNMGKYTPYKFVYSNNKPYDLKAYDAWGTYKSTAGTGQGVNHEPTTAEYPYVIQDKTIADANVSAWSLTSIILPSGGKIEVTYESDDYAYVQDKKAMEMFKIRGAGDDVVPTGNFDDKIYSNGSRRYLYVELPGVSPSELTDPDPSKKFTIERFKQKYLEPIKNDPIYFNVMLNMTSNKYDYVSGYFKIDPTAYNDVSDLPGDPPGMQVFNKNNKVYASIPMQFLDINSGDVRNFGDGGENPISKAGWYFARTYVNRIAFGQEEFESFDVGFIVNKIINTIGDIITVFQGPDRYLRDHTPCGKKISTTKSWIRLLSPSGKKLGGSSRVSKLKIYDNWEVMTGNTNSPDVNRYAMTYGQEFKYENEDGTSSGVATFEPYGSKENPFVMPFEDHTYKRILAPAEKNYVEKPLGVAFYPAAKITYGRVEVKNISPADITQGDQTLTMKKHATGKTVHEFYTTKDFPTIAKNTVIEMDHYGLDEQFSFSETLFGLNLNTQKDITLSQGFVVITNDMDGKPKRVTTYSEYAQNVNDYITQEEYIYNTDAQGALKSVIPVIDEKGIVTERTVGVDYEVVNDFRTSRSDLDTYGVDANLAVVPALFGIPLPIPNGAPTNAHHSEELRMVTTTKVIHKTGILVEKRVHDGTAQVITKNLAWDANTGGVLLTEITNEYADRYYNFNYPAYWKYKGMNKASKNLDMDVKLNAPVAGQYSFTNAGQYLVDGDEVWAGNIRAWVIDVGVAGADKFKLMKRNGDYLTTPVSRMKIKRSGYRNLQGSMMSSITLMKNPIRDNANNLKNITNADFSAATKVINASAIEYKDTWPSQCECDAPEMVFDTHGKLVTTGYNPYVFNIKGDWRPVKSYAYLTGRTSTASSTANPNPRNTGYYTTFNPFYKLNAAQTGWETDMANWTFASEISQYSPYGNEVENKDALGRHSAAQYGFNKNIAVAVGANTQYKEMGYDSFEDYAFTGCSDHFSFKDAFKLGTAGQSDEEAHTGMHSYRLDGESAAAISKAVVVCESEDAAGLLVALINRLIEMNNNNDPTLTSAPFTIPEMQALAPYIVLPQGYQGVVQPKICNLVINTNQSYISFNFYPVTNDSWDTTQRHVYWGLGQVTATEPIDHVFWGYAWALAGWTSFWSWHPNPTTGFLVSSTISGGHYNNRSLYTRYINFNGANCMDCTSFAPNIGKTYWVSAWVKEKDINGNPVSPEQIEAAQLVNYGNSKMRITFEAGNYQILSSTEFVTTGEIIDGWQRIVGKVTVPADSKVMKFELLNTGSTYSYFDDVRMHPVNGSMKSFAYDPETLRLMAELDDNNYATFYEYDKEGGLVRVKKETARGVMTIKESRSGNPKTALNQ